MWPRCWRRWGWSESETVGPRVAFRENRSGTPLRAKLGSARTEAGWLAASHFGWRQLAIDAFRQDLFEARDRLFDLALEGDGSGFGFGHPVYGTLRRQFNGAIRLAHRLSMIQVCVFFVCRLVMGPRKKFEELFPPIESRLDGIDDRIQAQILHIRKEWDNATLRLLKRTSPLFYVAYASLFLCLFVSKLAGYVASRVVLWRRVSDQISCTVWQDVALADYVEQFEADELENRQRGQIVPA